MAGKPKARIPLGDLIGIPDLLDTQDWDLVHASPRRVEEFCQLYESAVLEPWERTDLMSLIVASLDERLSASGPAPKLEAEVTRLLVRDAAANAETIAYWACMDRPSGWDVTPMMRAVWERIHEPPDPLRSSRR